MVDCLPGQLFGVEGGGQRNHILSLQSTSILDDR